MVRKGCRYLKDVDFQVEKGEFVAIPGPVRFREEPTLEYALGVWMCRLGEYFPGRAAIHDMAEKADGTIRN